MSIQEYMGTVGMRFWRSLPVTLVLTAAEWAVFLCFIWHWKKRGHDRVKQFFFVCCGFLAYMALQFTYIPVLLNCLLALLIWTSVIFACCDCNWETAVFESSLLCICLEAGKSFCRNGLLAYGVSKMVPGISGDILSWLMGILYLIWLFLLAGISLLFRKDRGRLSISSLQMAGLVFPLFLYLFFRQFQYTLMESSTPYEWLRLDILQYSIALCDLIVMATMEQMIAAQSRQKQLLEKQLLLEKQQKQLVIQEESMKAVRQRYHDLKHYMTGLRTLLDKDIPPTVRSQIEKFADDLKNEIEPFESIVKTGNETLDILVAERTNECVQKGIRLVPYIDARDIGQIDVMHLCAIFGNAMDNAIEATETLKYVNMKEIGIKIGTEGQMLVMRFHNYYDQEPVKEGTHLKSTKKDQAEHGFGLKNIEKIVESYNGVVSYEAHNGEFTLNILIPVES